VTLQIVKLGEILNFLPKSKLQVSNSKEDGKYKFFTSSLIQKKWIDTATFNCEGLVFGTGGSASIHYVNGKFSTSTDCFVLAPKSSNNLFVKYIYYFLNSNLHILEEGFKGAGLKHISKKYIQDLEVPIPPLAEQQRVAALLDTANRILKLRDSSIVKLDQLTQSVFVEMFGKHVTKLKLKDTCSFVSGGTPSKDDANFWGGEIAWISSADIEVDRVKEIRHFVTESAVNSSATNPIQPNNVLVVTRTGVGKVVVTDRKFCFSQDITGLVLKKEFMPEFIAASIRSKQHEIIEQARGATIKGVTREVIANVEIPAASYLEQQKFSERIQRINSQKKYFEIHRIKIKALLASFQHQSFAVN
jgi:type I restriction enzyme S subunit